MMPSYLKNALNVKETPQHAPIPGTTQVPNSAGDYVFALDDWARLQRWLLLGTESPTYYASQKDLTAENVECVTLCLAADVKRTVDMIVEISQAGRAPKNDPAILALAMAASYRHGESDKEAVAVRQYALAELRSVARIGTHLFQFCEFVDKMRGWGPALKKAVAGWYSVTEQVAVPRLVRQVLKYQQRGGWSHRDVLRLVHPKPQNTAEKAIYKYVTSGEMPKDPVEGFELVGAFERAKTASVADVRGLIEHSGLTREMIPTEHLNDPAVWDALLERMPMGAMIRNLGKMSQVGLLKPMSNAVGTVVKRLTDQEIVHKARIHPIGVLAALMIYRSGHGHRGKLAWTPVPQLIDALDGAFYLAFENAPVTGKRIYLGIDVSGSMTWSSVNGMDFIQAREAAAAMAMTIVRTEPNYYVAGFCSGMDSGIRRTMLNYHGQPRMVQLNISMRDRLDRAMEVVQRSDFGATDCALPMLDALERKMPIDAFVVLTDNETWAGDIHPCQALVKYRNATGIPAKLVVVGMTSTGFSIADPKDGGMMDVVGLDTAAPALIADFIAEVA